ncbi:1-phosphofructokinase [Bacillus sp. CH30_1T]|uniref:1-phosphofructokinase n=1 Tax=Bacillus sp. CH30_1T TaxID=2604836 RepID=UPI0011EBDA73|nr:1-phosphofructokinase [Bacillus sp. CH30_1T]KAA0565745.1 1-phosphofructokinase [Bacillus sp. CH30_1T]
MGKPMIATVTLNPAIDVRYTLSQFKMGEVNRVSTIDKSAGGKGLNVTRVLSQLGQKVTCTGFLGGKSGEWIENQLSHLEVHNSFVPIKGETRTCLAILSKEGQTEILETGPFISSNELEIFDRTFSSILDTVDFVVVSGSLPEGVPTDFYRELTKKANQKGVRLLLDTSGPGLAAGIAGKPFLIKPNKEEFARLIGRTFGSTDDMLRHAQAICQKGIHYVLLSLGEEGAILVNGKRILRAKVPRVKAVNPVGSGDSMLAGFTYAYSHGFPIEEVLKWACACGMSNAIMENTGEVNLLDIRRFVKEIDVIE